MSTLVAPQPNTAYFGALAAGTVYYSNAKRRIVATDAADILALKAQGCDITVTDGVAAIPTVAVAAGAANVMTITVTSKDVDGNTVAGVQEFELFMSGAATGTGLTAAAYSGSLVAVTGALLTTLTAKKHFTLVTDATGVFVGSLTDTGKPATEYVCIRKPRSPDLVISAASGTNWG